MLVSAVHDARGKARCRHHLFQFFGMADIDAEHDPLFEESVPRIEVLLQRPDDQFVSRIDDQCLLEIRVIVVLPVIADRGQVDVGNQAVAADIRDHIFVDRFPQRQIRLVVAEDILQLLLVQPLRRCGQPDQVLGREVLQCFGTIGCLRMLCLVEQHIVKIVFGRTFLLR